MPVFDKATINQVQQASDIVDVIAEHVSLTRKGKEMVGLCPFHDDHRPSLCVNPDKQIFKCFSCGAGGSVFTFVQMRENLSFPQAIKRLAERAGITLKPQKASRDEDKSPDIDPNKLAKVNAWAAAHFQKNLLNTNQGKRTLEYLAQRQITPESTKHWQLGLAVDASDDLIRAAKVKNIPQKLLAQAGLILERAGSGEPCDKFVNRLMFPITDVTGRAIGFGGRTLNDDGAKYINSPTTVLFDKSNCLYGLHHARQQFVSTGTAVAVEGYTDCIMAHQFGCKNVVATLGTSFTTGQARIFRRYAKKIVLVFDSDTAGLEAANRALQICLSQRINIEIACLPQAKDPCDFILSNGAQEFQRLVEQATDVFEFKWNRLKENFKSQDNLVDNKSALEEFLQTIATSIYSGNLPVLDRGLIVNRLSKIIGLSRGEINAELRKRTARAARTASYNLQNPKVKTVDLGRGLFATAQREVIEVLLNEPKLFQLVKQKITADTFDVPILRQIATGLFETLNKEPSAPLKMILAQTESLEEDSVIVKLAQSGEEKGNFKTRLTGALNAIQQCQLQNKKNKIRTIKDQKQFLQRFSENTERRNPRNVGMV